MTAYIGLSPKQLLGAADELERNHPPELAGRWPMAVALLCRQALEISLVDLWAAQAPGVDDATMRAQLLCLPDYLGDAGLATRAAVTWYALSNACHHHAYELPPTSSELDRWFDTVEAVVRRIDGAVSRRR